MPLLAGSSNFNIVITMLINGHFVHDETDDSLRSRCNEYPSTSINDRSVQTHGHTSQFSDESMIVLILHR